MSHGGVVEVPKSEEPLSTFAPLVECGSSEPTAIMGAGETADGPRDGKQGFHVIQLDKVLKIYLIHKCLAND